MKETPVKTRECENSYQTFMLCLFMFALYIKYYFNRDYSVWQEDLPREEELSHKYIRIEKKNNF